MKTKSQKRARARRISLAGGMSAPQLPHPRDRTHTNQPEDARKTALQARCRVFAGVDGPKDEKASGEPLWGCSVGRMILVEAFPGQWPDMPYGSAGRDVKVMEARKQLWNAAQHARQTQLAYDRAIGSPKRHAQVARILAPVTAFEADASSPAPDFRSDDEKYRQAIAAQMRVEGWIGHTDKAAMSAFKQAVINDPDGRIRDWDGVRACLQCIAEGLKGEAVEGRIRT